MRHHHVVLDPDASVGREGVDDGPVEGCLRFSNAMGAEQHRHEVNAGFNGEDVADFHDPGVAQVRMPVGRRQDAALARLLVAADVVNLNAEVMAHAVREEHRCVSLLDRFIERTLQDALLDKQLSDPAVRGEVNGNVRLARLRQVTEPKLQRVQGGGQDLEARIHVLGHGGAGDVGAVAVVARSRVEEQQPPRSGGALGVVVQDRGLGVEAYDGRIGKEVFAGSRSAQEGVMDGEFAFARMECRLGGEVSLRPGDTGAAQAFDFIGSLDGAIPVQSLDHVRRIGGEARGFGARFVVAHEHGAAQRTDLREHAFRGVGFVDVELADPEVRRERRAFVPVVLRGPADEARLRSRLHHDRVMRSPERAEAREVRVRLEGRLHVVRVIDHLRPGAEDESVEARFSEGLVCGRGHLRGVFAEQLREIHGANARRGEPAPSNRVHQDPLIHGRKAGL